MGKESAPRKGEPLGDLRYSHVYQAVRQAPDRSSAIRALPDEDVIAALAAASMAADGVLVNVLATEAQNRALRSRRVLLSMNDAVLVVSLPDRRIVDANPAAERMLGLEADELRGEPTSLVSVDAARDAQLGKLLEETVHHDGARFELPLRRADGHVFPAEHTVSLLRDLMGEPTGFVVIVHDLTERERALRHATLRHDTLRVLLGARSLDQAVLPVMQMVCRALGWDAGAFWRLDPETGALRCADVWRAPGSDLAEDFDEHLRAQPEPPGAGGEARRSGQPFWSVDLAASSGPGWASHPDAARLRTAFGFPVRSASRLVGVVAFLSREARPSDPATLGLAEFMGGQLGQFVDRNAAETKFRTIVESAPDAMVIVDETGRITLVNSETERLFGYARGELVGQPVEVLMPEGVRRRHERHREDYAQEPRRRPMGVGLDLNGRRKDGSEFPVDISLSPLRTESEDLVVAAIREARTRDAGRGRVGARAAER